MNDMQAIVAPGRSSQMNMTPIHEEERVGTSGGVSLI